MGSWLLFVLTRGDCLYVIDMFKLAVFGVAVFAIQAVVCDNEHKDNHHKDRDVDIHNLKAPECAPPMEEECNTILVYGKTSKDNMFVNECCCLNHKEKEMLGCAMFALDPEEQPGYAAKVRRSADPGPDPENP